MGLSCLIRLLFFAVAFSTVSGLKCYHCESAKHLLCQESMYYTKSDTAFVTECKGSCKRSYLYELNSFGLVRMCDPDAKNETDRCFIQKSSGHFNSICYCQTDFCNGSNLTTKINVGIIALSLILFYLLRCI